MTEAPTRNPTVKEAVAFLRMQGIDEAYARRCLIYWRIHVGESFVAAVEREMAKKA